MSFSPLGANSAPPNPIAGFEGPLRGREREEKGKRRQGKKEEKGRKGQENTPHEINVWFLPVLLYPILLNH